MADKKNPATPKSVYLDSIKIQQAMSGSTEKWVKSGPLISVGSEQLKLDRDLRKEFSSIVVGVDLMPDVPQEPSPEAPAEPIAQEQLETPQDNQSEPTDYQPLEQVSDFKPPEISKPEFGSIDAGVIPDMPDLPPSNLEIVRTADEVKPYVPTKKEQISQNKKNRLKEQAIRQGKGRTRPVPLSKLREAFPDPKTSPAHGHEFLADASNTAHAQAFNKSAEEGQVSQSEATSESLDEATETLTSILELMASHLGAMTSRLRQVEAALHQMGA
jgi:hypothetical protein